MHNKDKETNGYVPPPAAWRLPQFIKASSEEIQAKVVDCPTCPVFMLCVDKTGGTGYTCKECGGTAVWVDAPELETGIPKDILIIDCNKHQFEKPESKQVSRCSLCSGGIMQLEVLQKSGKTRSAHNHVIFTKYAAVSVEKRHAVLNKAWERWIGYYDAVKAAEKK